MYRMTTAVLLAIWLLITAVAWSVEATDFVDPNGVLDKAALLAWAKAQEPNEPAEPNVPNRPAFKLPFINQWLEEPGMQTTRIRIQHRKIEHNKFDGRPIEWIFNDGQWVPGTGDQPYLTREYVLESATIELGNIVLDVSDANSITVRAPVPLSCDLNGDGTVNFIDYALWARERAIDE